MGADPNMGDDTLERLRQSWEDGCQPIWTLDDNLNESLGNEASQQYDDFSTDDSADPLLITMNNNHHSSQPPDPNSLFATATATVSDAETGAVELPTTDTDTDLGIGATAHSFEPGTSTVELLEREFVGAIRYDGLGRVDIDHWPFDEQQAPPPTPFVESAVRKLQSYDPQASIKVSMVPCMVSLEPLDYPMLLPWMSFKPGELAPLNCKFQYVPAIECVECPHRIAFFSPYEAPPNLNDHWNTPLHKQKPRAARLRLIAESTTAKKVKFHVFGNRDGLAKGPYSSLRHMPLTTIELDGLHLQHAHCSMLIHAVKEGDIDCLRALLDEGLDVTRRDSLEQSALDWACELDRAEAAKLLIDKGAKLYPNGQRPTPPLVLALHAGHVDTAIELVAYAAGRESDSGKPLLYPRAHPYPELVKKLLDAGADPNESSVFEFPLGRALLYAPCKAVQYLLEAGARRNTISDFDWRVFHSKAYCRDRKEKLSLIRQYGLDTRYLSTQHDTTDEAQPIGR